VTTKTLTDSAIKALSAGEEVWDKLVPGLHVRAGKDRKAFYLFFRTKAGVVRRPKLGDCTILTIGVARETARDMLGLVATGKDPVADQTKVRGEPTVNVFFERCWNEHWSKTKDARNVRRIYDARIAPRLGNHRVRAVCYEDIVGLHRALEATPYEANRCLSHLSKLLNLAERHGERALNSNPCRHIQRYPELSRRRFATGTELAKIGPLLDKAWEGAFQLGGNPLRQRRAAAFIGLMIFTGMRPKEVETGRREWIHGEVLRLPDSKTGQRDVYLPPQAVGVIERLAAPAKDAAGLTPLVGIAYPRKTWDWIRKEAGCPDLRLYDLRRTFATVSLAGGNSIGLIGEMLGHKTSQTTKVYARLMNEAATGAAQATGDRLAGLLGRT
jgi:integrase